MKANHQYILSKCSVLAREGAVILDYGCGNGSIVKAGLNSGLNIYGAEAFGYGSGTTIREQINADPKIHDRIREIDIEKNYLAFPSNHFDLVFSNMVFEHVVDIESAFSEIYRVLKPGGKVFLLFPSKEVIREGHCGVLFAHWMPKSRARYYWLLLNRKLGIARGKGGRTPKQWAEFFNDWLVDSVSYRKTRDINQLLGGIFSNLGHVEDDYLSFRLERIGYRRLASMAKSIPFKKLSGIFVRKWGSLVIVGSKG